MDHIRSLVALSHDKTAPDLVQFIAYYTIYTQLRYKLSILKSFRTNTYEPTRSLIATTPLGYGALVARNEEISTESDEYRNNEIRLSAIEAQKNAEIDIATTEFMISVDTLLESAYMARFKYSPKYLDMLRRQLWNHFP
jgi:hypothetical protein